MDSIYATYEKIYEKIFYKEEKNNNFREYTPATVKEISQPIIFYSCDELLDFLDTFTFINDINRSTGNGFTISENYTLNNIYISSFCIQEDINKLIKIQSRYRFIPIRINSIPKYPKGNINREVYDLLDLTSEINIYSNKSINKAFDRNNILNIYKKIDSNIKDYLYRNSIYSVKYTGDSKIESVIFEDSKLSCNIHIQDFYDVKINKNVNDNIASGILDKYKEKFKKGRLINYEETY